jgi:hypothetical protein
MQSWGYSHNLIPDPSPQVKKGDETNYLDINPIYYSGFAQ